MIWLMYWAGLWLTVASDPIHFHIEERVDDLMPKVHHYIKQRNLEEIAIPDFGGEAAPVFIGVTLKNLSTIYRKGDAEMWQPANDKLSAKIVLGLKDLEVHVKLCTFMNNSLTLTVGESTLEVGFTLHPTPESLCVTTWDYFNITQLDNLLVRSANTEWNNKSPPDQILKDIIPYYNKWNNLKKIRDAASQQLNLCQAE